MSICVASTPPPPPPPPPHRNCHSYTVKGLSTDNHSSTEHLWDMMDRIQRRLCTHHIASRTSHAHPIGQYKKFNRIQHQFNTKTKAGFTTSLHASIQRSDRLVSISSSKPPTFQFLTSYECLCVCCSCVSVI